MQDKRKREPTSLELITQLKKQKFDAFLRELRDAQAVLCEEIKTVQARLAAIEDYLADEGCSSQGDSEGDCDEHGIEGIRHSDYDCSQSEHDRDCGTLESDSHWNRCYK